MAFFASLASAAVPTLLGSIFGSSGASNPTQTQSSTQTTNRTVPSYLQPWLQQIGTQSQSLMNTPYQPYTGQQVAGFNPQQQQAFGLASGMVGQAQPAFQQGLGLVGQAGQTGITGNYGSQIQNLMNPYTKNVVDAQTKLALQNYQLQKNQLLDKQGQTGAFGGSRSAVGLDNLSSQFQQNLGAMQSGLLSQGYGQALNAAQYGNSQAMQAGQGLGGLATGMQNAGVGQMNALLNTGGLQQANQQQQLNTQYQNYLNQLQYPYTQQQFGLSQLQGLSGMVGGSTGISTGTASQAPGTPSYAASLSGGLLAQQAMNGGTNPFTSLFGSSQPSADSINWNSYAPAYNSNMNQNGISGAYQAPYAEGGVVEDNSLPNLAALGPEMARRAALGLNSSTAYARGGAVMNPYLHMQNGRMGIPEGLAMMGRGAYSPYAQGGFVREPSNPHLHAYAQGGNVGPGGGGPMQQGPNYQANGMTNNAAPASTGTGFNPGPGPIDNIQAPQDNSKPHLMSQNQIDAQNQGAFNRANADPMSGKVNNTFGGVEDSQWLAQDNAKSAMLNKFMDPIINSVQYNKGDNSISQGAAIPNISAIQNFLNTSGIMNPETATINGQNLTQQVAYNPQTIMSELSQGEASSQAAAQQQQAAHQQYLKSISGFQPGAFIADLGGLAVGAGMGLGGLGTLSLPSLANTAIGAAGQYSMGNGVSGFGNGSGSILGIPGHNQWAEGGEIHDCYATGGQLIPRSIAGYADGGMIGAMDNLFHIPQGPPQQDIPATAQSQGQTPAQGPAFYPQTNPNIPLNGKGTLADAKMRQKMIGTLNNYADGGDVGDVDAFLAANPQAASFVGLGRPDANLGSFNQGFPTMPVPMSNTPLAKVKQNIDAYNEIRNMKDNTLPSSPIYDEIRNMKNPSLMQQADNFSQGFMGNVAGGIGDVANFHSPTFQSLAAKGGYRDTDPDSLGSIMGLTDQKVPEGPSLPGYPPNPAFNPTSFSNTAFDGIKDSVSSAFHPILDSLAGFKMPTQPQSTTSAVASLSKAQPDASEGTLKFSNVNMPMLAMGTAMMNTIGKSNAPGANNTGRTLGAGMEAYKDAVVAQNSLALQSMKLNEQIKMEEAHSAMFYGQANKQNAIASMDDAKTPYAAQLEQAKIAHLAQTAHADPYSREAIASKFLISSGQTGKQLTVDQALAMADQIRGGPAAPSTSGIPTADDIAHFGATTGIMPTGQ